MTARPDYTKMSGEGTKRIRFVMLAKRWYADIEEWEGSADNLEMVAGAETY